MIEAPIYKQGGDTGGAVQLPDHLFTLPWSDELVHQVVVGIAGNQRAATAHTKGRSAVRGGGRKAVATEGDRPGTARVYSVAALGWRRCYIRAEQGEAICKGD